MNTDGTAYVLKWINEELPDFITDLEIEELKKAPVPTGSMWKTLYISGGRRDKISKGDIVGLFLKQGKLNKDQLGTIEIKQDCAYIGIVSSKMNHAIRTLNNSKLKKKKIRISEI